MKLSKRTGLVIAIGIFVIAAAVLSMMRSQMVDEQEKMNKELATAQVKLKGLQLEQLSSQMAELDKQQSQMKSQIEAVKGVLSQSVRSTAASSVLYDIAEASGLEVTEVSSSGSVTGKLEGVTCLVVSLTAKVEGDAPNLVTFINQLSSYFPNGVVNSVTITIPEKDKGEKALADIKLVVYTYKGS